MVKNIDEIFILNLANGIPGVCARLGTPEEDCGYHKADVVLAHLGKTYYLQVSRTPKSKKEQKKLFGRGTYPISTHSFDRALIPEEITEKIKYYLQNF